MASSIINSDDGVISGTSGLKSSGGDDGNLNIQSNGTTVAAVSDGAFQIGGNNISADNSLGFRNRIINGDMRIDQRNAGAAVTVNSGAPTLFPVDRFTGSFFAATGALSLQQSADAPSGFKNSIIATVTTNNASLGSTETVRVEQRIEGFNTSDLMQGSASAKSFTLGFWVKSSLTGTFGGTIRNGSPSPDLAVYTFSYSISVADTWEYKTITIPGTTLGVWLTTNGIGMIVQWSLGAGTDRLASAGSWSSTFTTGVTGQVNVIGTSSATWQVTGVQLEVGSVATPFERRPYGTELSLCQRYLPAFPVTASLWRIPAVGLAASTNTVYLTLTFPTTTRVPPTGMTVSAAADWRVGVDGIVATVAFSTLTFSTLASNNAARITGTVATTPFTVGQVVAIDSNSATANLYFTGCEL